MRGPRIPETRLCAYLWIPRLGSVGWDGVTVPQLPQVRGNSRVPALRATRPRRRLGRLEGRPFLWRSSFDPENHAQTRTMYRRGPGSDDGALPRLSPRLGSLSGKGPLATESARGPRSRELTWSGMGAFSPVPAMSRAGAPRLSNAAAE